MKEKSYMSKELIKEKIKFYTETIKIFWTLFIVLTGGLATLIFNLDNILKFGLFTLGLLFEYVVIMIIKDYNQKILKLLDEWENN